MHAVHEESLAGKMSHDVNEIPNMFEMRLSLRNHVGKAGNPCDLVFFGMSGLFDETLKTFQSA